MEQAHFTRAWVSWPKLAQRLSNWRKLGVGAGYGGGKARVSGCAGTGRWPPVAASSSCRADRLTSELQRTV